MSARQLLGIFGVLALLLGAWLLTRAGKGDADRTETSDGLAIAALLGRPGDVATIRVERAGGDTLRLERRAGGWRVNGYPADDSLVEATLGAIAALPPLRMIALNRASHDRMGLAADSATRVRFGGSPAGAGAEILVGGKGRDGRFVRLPDADPAYVGPSVAFDPLAGGEVDWRDFRIARVDTATLRRIVVRRGDRVAAVAEREVAVEGPAAEGAPPVVRAGPWTVEDLAADTAVMRLYVGALADLEATGFPADSFVLAADFEHPEATVELFDAVGGDGLGPDVTLLFSTGLDHPDVLVRRGDSPIVYAIDRARANLLTTTPARLLGRL